MDEAGKSEADLGEPVRDGGPDEAAHFIVGAVAELSALARNHRFEMLSYLLDMAHLEAREIYRRGQRGQP